MRWELFVSDILSFFIDLFLFLMHMTRGKKREHFEFFFSKLIKFIIYFFVVVDINSHFHYQVIYSVYRKMYYDFHS
jgi:hypothetical protein